MFDTDISRVIQAFVLIIPGFLLAITVHEYTHGYVALRYGDPTAKLAGRLTFNPIGHLDLFGTIFLIATVFTGFGIGWAKPVPVDPRYLRNPRRDMMWISLGGPAANMVAATALALVFRAMVLVFEGKAAGPVTYSILAPLVGMIQFGVRINVVLAIFNLIPVPPLDGSKILQGLLPRDLAYQFEKTEPYGFVVLILLLMTGVINYLIIPPIMFIERLLLGGFG
jgi:Zn-dependent protease